MQGFQKYQKWENFSVQYLAFKTVDYLPVKQKKPTKK